MFNIIHPARETSDVLQICRISIDANFPKQSYTDKAITLIPQRNPGVLSAERVSRDSEIAAKRKDTDNAAVLAQYSFGRSKGDWKPARCVHRPILNLLNLRCYLLGTSMSARGRYFSDMSRRPT
jgi:hypothetical protein